MFGPESREAETRKKERTMQEQREEHRAQSLDTWGSVFDDYVEDVSEQNLIEPSHQLTIGSDF